jgi:hypothetical protein
VHREKQEFSVFSRKTLSERHDGKDNHFECLQNRIRELYRNHLPRPSAGIIEVPERMSEQSRLIGLLRMSFAILPVVTKRLLLRGHRVGETRMFRELLILKNLCVLCG